ncbi:N-acetylmuramic acid 6-phosphate etherase [Anaerovibrio slackiae]|uniref:N-acetylmuramic acid 6-phosphate etherase n=1 Tax=Anaerovibrio slackiae TaxID=2652309 RepID=UPI003865A6A1
MDVLEKLTILTDAAKYDAACTSSGGSRSFQKGHIGNTSSSVAGCCHSFSADGRCVTLLKVLMTNRCVYDCKYCVNRRSNDTRRAIFTPEELADLTISFYRRNYIEGLFLSSGVYRSPDYTTELMIKALRLLREMYRFNGYIHAKAIPGTAPELVQGLIAGGQAAMFTAQEGAEDSEQLAADDLAAARLNEKDALVALAASGRTPYSIGALKYARARGAAAIALVCSPNSPMSKEAILTICPLPGPEVITGSTRLKAGTAQKLVLNMLSTGIMIKLGKVYGNLMVDVQATNQKLAERSKLIVMEATGCSRAEAEAALDSTDGSAKLAIFLRLSGLDVQTAKQKLKAADGYVAKALMNCTKASPVHN